MAAFSYTAVDRAGKQQKGILDADSARHVRSLLREQALMPLAVAPAAQSENKQSISAFDFRRPSLNVADLALITRQMATLIQAGIPLEEGLATVAKQSDKARVNGILLAVRAKVLEGYTLADAMADFPSVFNDLYRSTVAAGESAGHLDAVIVKIDEVIAVRQREEQVSTEQRDRSKEEISLTEQEAARLGDKIENRSPDS